MTSPNPGVGLADRQGLLREVRRLSESRLTRSGRHRGPWIALSRELGCGGLRARAARRRGARMARLRPRAPLRRSPRRPITTPSRSSASTRRASASFGEYLAPFILPDDPGQARVLVGLRHVIQRIGSEGKAVLVGRGANFVLHPAGGLRVRAVGRPPSARRLSRGPRASPSTRRAGASRRATRPSAISSGRRTSARSRIRPPTTSSSVRSRWASRRRRRRSSPRPAPSSGYLERDRSEGNQGRFNRPWLRARRITSVRLQVSLHFPGMHLRDVRLPLVALGLDELLARCARRARS